MDEGRSEMQRRRRAELGSRDLCVERVAAREQRETARPIIDGALLGEQVLEFSRHFQHISPPFQAARCNAQSTTLDRLLSPPRINKVGPFHCMSIQ